MESLRAWHQTVFPGKRTGSPFCRLPWRMRLSRMLARGHLVALTLCTLLTGAGPLRAGGRGPEWSRWRPPLGERSRETFSEKSIEIDAAIDELRIIEKDPFLSAEDKAAVQRRIARLENLAVNTGYDEYSAAWREHEELMAKGRAEGRLSEEDARRAEQLRRTMIESAAKLREPRRLGMGRVLPLDDANTELGAANRQIRDLNAKLDADPVRKKFLEALDEFTKELLDKVDELKGKSAGEIKRALIKILEKVRAGTAGHDELRNAILDAYKKIGKAAVERILRNLAARIRNAALRRAAEAAKVEKKEDPDKKEPETKEPEKTVPLPPPR